MKAKIQTILEQAGVKFNCYGKPIPASLAANFDEVVKLIVAAHEYAISAAWSEGYDQAWDEASNDRSGENG
jgi:hypothetical protein